MIILENYNQNEEREVGARFRSTVDQVDLFFLVALCFCSLAHFALGSCNIVYEVLNLEENDIHIAFLPFL